MSDQSFKRSQASEPWLQDDGVAKVFPNRRRIIFASVALVLGLGFSLSQARVRRDRSRQPLERSLTMAATRVPPAMGRMALPAPQRQFSFSKFFQAAPSRSTAYQKTSARDGYHYESGKQQTMAVARSPLDMVLDQIGMARPQSQVALEPDVDWHDGDSTRPYSSRSHKRGVLLVNVGTPDEPTTASVEKYLEEFLLDPDVIDIPAPLRYLLVKGFVLRSRPPKIAPRYASIWLPDGAPLRVYTQRMADAMSQKQNTTVFEVGMRYGNPSIRAALERLQAKGVTDLLVAPLFPHFAQATTGSSVKQAHKELKAMGWNPSIRELGWFPTAPQFVDPLAASIRQHLQPTDHLLFSYHGLPLSQVKRECSTHRQDKSGSYCLKKGDCSRIPAETNKKCYAHQCSMTTLATVAKLGLTEDRWSQSYQSRLGPAEWLSPSTSSKVKELAARGIKRLVIVAPAFVADGLETLEELQDEVAGEFKEAGGEHVVVVPCLNDNPDWINGLGELVAQAFEEPPIDQALDVAPAGHEGFIDQADKVLRGGRQ